MTPASKGIWNRIAHRLKELGLAPAAKANVPQWLLGEVLKGRVPELTELVVKLMSRGFDALKKEEREALLRGILGDKPKS